MPTRPPFVGDLEAPLHGLTLRSPIARGRLLGIESPKLPANYALLRGEDIPGRNQLADIPVPVLAGEALSYYGEPVGLLVGPDTAQLEALAAQCVIRTEEEPPRFTPDALSETFARRDQRIGEPEAVFQEAPRVVEGIYHTGIQDHWYSEPAGALAIWEAGRVLIRTATQWPFHVRRSVAAVLGIPEDAVSVEPTRLGIHLDGKIWYPSLIACQAALGAFSMNRTVKLMLSRIEDFRYSPKRNGAEIRLRSALGEGGELLATEVEVLTDLGSSGVFAEEILDRTCMGALGVYNQDALILRGTAAATNAPPGGPLGGFGMAQGFFAMERHASLLADTSHCNPLEWRKRNFLNRKKPLASGLTLGNRPPLEGILDTVAAMGDYHRKWASYETLRVSRRGGKREPFEAPRGIGIAIAYQGGGFLYTGEDRGDYAVTLTLDKEGNLEIRTSAVSTHDGYRSLWQTIAAETLSIDPQAVRIVTGTTDEVPDSGPSSLSRNSTVVTRLVEQACAALGEQRFRDPLPITVTRSYHPVPRRIWNDRAIDQNAFTYLGWGAAVVEVAVDPLEYTTTVRGVYLAVDGGKILSEDQARRSLKFAAIQALGWASRETLGYEEGKIPDWRIFHYDIPDPRESPPVYIDFLWNERIIPRGIGELPFNCVPAAYAQAVSQAMDHPFTRLPITPRDIWNAVRGAENPGEAE